MESSWYRYTGIKETKYVDGKREIELFMGHNKRCFEISPGYEEEFL